MSNPVDIKVWGEYACFTRPEFKVERVSYPVMTPSAARGVLEAIYWKPQFRYRIQRIGVIQQGSHFAFLRNEIKSRQSKDAKGIDYAIRLLRDPEGEVKKAGKGKTKQETAEENVRKQFVIAEEDRAQRTALVLQNVCYRITAWIDLRNGESNIGKHLDCFRRRIERGECFHRPYLGCREFAADFEPATNSDTPDPNLSVPIGTMLFDTAYIDDPTWHDEHKQDRLEFWRHDLEEPREAKGYAKRLFFPAEVKSGWLTVPKEKYDELDRLEAGHGTA